MKRFLTTVGIIAGIHFILCSVLFVLTKNGGYGLFSTAALDLIGQFLGVLVPVIPDWEPKTSFSQLMMTFLLGSTIWSLGLCSLVYVARFIYSKRDA